MKINQIIKEGEFRANDVEEFKPSNKALNDLKSKYLPDWEMLDHRILQAKYVAADHREAEAFVRIINKLSERMDHFCEVTQDVAEVTVKTTTFDVKGLTILDFQIAMVIDRFASDVGIKQAPMSGNFGMHEDIMLDEGIIDAITDFLKPYVEKAQAKLKKLQGAVKQEYMETDLMWEIMKKGNKARPFEIEFANKQFKDVLKGVGLGAWLALPIPGNTLWITLLEKLLNKFDISIMPDEVKRQVFNSMYENFADGKKKGITDDWFKDGFKTYKIPNREKYKIADQDGIIQTLEGPVNYKKGYYIMTGPKGEQYPIPPEKFKELKDDHGNGIATPKKIIKMAKLADHDGDVKTSWGETLRYTKDEDYIVRHGSNDFGVVKVDIFKQTYKQINVQENFADGKRKGKSRPGRVKRAGASCKGSVTKLRKQAKNASGEKAKMYHWCANMKGGKK